MLDKIYRVSPNLVMIYYTNREPLRVTSDDGTALEYALSILKHVAHFTDDELEATQVLVRQAS